MQTRFICKPNFISDQYVLLINEVWLARLTNNVNQTTFNPIPDADLVISKNQFVSTTHCVLVRGGGGEVWIRDTSTNGTLLNGTRLERNKEVWSLHNAVKLDKGHLFAMHTLLQLSYFT